MNGPGDRPPEEELEALIAAAREGSLEPDEAAEIALLADLLADPATWADAPEGLEDAVVEAVASAPADDESEPRSAATLTPIASAGSAGTRHPRRRRLALALTAAAAVLVIAVGVTVVASRGTNADYKSQLSATGLAPRAHGSAVVTRNAAGFRVELDATGLPVLHGSQYYQAWLKNAAGTLVPIGTFSSSNGKVTLWSGVSPQDFPTMSVTVESADNNQTSSGRRVLVGAVRPQ